MNLPVVVSHRKVKRIRLQINAAGLLVIVPKKFRGNIEDILTRHKLWIERQAGKFEQMQSEISTLPQEDRSMEELHKIALLQLRIIEDVIKVAPTKVTYRTMKTRWGSCSETGSLSLNTKLRFLPKDLVEYVVAHEAIHLIHHNHSKQFWETLSEFIPEFKENKYQLRLYAMLLENAPK